MNDDIKDPFGGLGIPIRLKKPDDFLKVRETLTRIGVASKFEKKLFQSCHILHKKQCYAIIHFKELFKLDGKASSITEEDIARRNSIANVLSQWGLVELVDPAKSAAPVAQMNQIKILSFADKKDWILEAKYNIGANKKKP